MREKMKNQGSKKTSSSQTITMFLAVLLIGVVFGLPDFDVTMPRFVVKDAEARIGRPATPASVAGVHRRTRRRTRRRHIAYGTRIYALPVGYTTVVVAGATYYVHEEVYYKPYYEGDKLVYVAVEKP
jgi:hypothetical protein